jgi:nucleotide-binding universal stress UspA family protein
MKQILVATDFSACAANAMEYALGLAKTLNMGVSIIHAIGSNEGVDNSIFNAIYIEEYQNKKKEALHTWANVYHNREEYKNVPLTAVCEVGGVSAVLSKHIDANPVEMLVMGNMGSTGISGLFGSNVHTMILKTKIPVLIVPLESKWIASPVIALAIDFATDLSAVDANALNELVKAANLSRLHVVNVIENNNWKTDEANEEKLRALIPNTALEFNYISENNPTDGILNFITTNETDILCLVKHHHNLLYRLFNKSTVNQVMTRSIKAILVLHE